MGDLRHGGVQALPQERLDTVELGSLALQRADLRKEQVDAHQHNKGWFVHGLRERALDLPRLVDLHRVPGLDVLVVGQHDTALEARQDLAHVVAHPSQGADLAVVDDRAVTDEAHLRAARDAALGDHAARDGADPRGTEGLAHLDLAHDVLDGLRGEHALHGVPQFVDRAVDDRVRPDLHALAVGQGARVAHRAHVEAHDDRVRGGGQVDVGLRDATDAGQHDVHLDLVLRELGDLVLERLERARHVGLEHQAEVVDLAALVEDRRQRALDAAAARLLLQLEPVGTLAGQRTGLAVVLDDAHVLARLGDAVEAEHLDRLRRRRGLHALAGVVGHRPHAAPVGARDDRVTDLQRAALHEHGHHGAAARIELGLDHGAGGLRVRVGGELLDVGHQQQALEQVVEALARLGRDVDEHRVAAPLLGLEPELGHLGAHAIGRRALLVALVDRHEDRHVGRLRVVDGLAGLRAHAVVGGDHDDRDVRRLGAAGTHGGERLVARRVQERDDAAVVEMDLVGADVLRDAAGLARGHVRLADRVQQRRLAVVDVTHDRDHRRARLEVLVGVLEHRLGRRVLGGRDDVDLLVELVGEHLDRVVGQRLRERRHLAETHQLLDDLRHRHAERLRHVLDGRAGGDADDIGLQRADVLGDGLLVGATPAPATATPRRTVRTAAGAATGATGTAARAAGTARPARGLRVDDDTPDAAGAARGALALQARAGGPLALAAAGTRAVAAGSRLGLGLRLRGRL